MVGPEILYVSITYEAMEDNSRYIVNWWSWKFKSRMGTRGTAIRYWLSNCEVKGSVPTKQAPLVRTAEQFQTERNSCPVLQPVLGFQLYRLMMNF